MILLIIMCLSFMVFFVFFVNELDTPFIYLENTEEQIRKYIQNQKRK